MLKKTLAIASLSAVLASSLASSAVAAPGDFVGNWVNTDPNTRGITRLVISSAGSNRLNIQVFGKCRPTDCDWGSTRLRTYGKNISDRNHKAATANYTTSFANTLLTLRLSGSTSKKINLQSFTEFTDRSNRQNYTSQYSFRQAGISTPKQLSPANGTVFNNFPRKTTLKWSSVSGAAKYSVEIDCYHCCQTSRWCSDVGRTWKVENNITNTSYTFNFVGAQPGRWRVWAVDNNGNASAKSGWWTFRYTR